MTKRPSKEIVVPSQEIGAGEGEVLLYPVAGGHRIEVRLSDQTVWLTQKWMADLFQSSVANINVHLKNIFKDRELDPDSVIKESLITATDGKRYRTKMYRLEAILAVGYRVKSDRGTQFRQWATERLKEYLVKGFVIDDERLKNPPVPGSGVPDYFDEMLERIRDIRASERRMYLRVREIFAMAGDYQPSLPETAKFFSVIQNKLHFAATGLTAAELIKARANHTQPNMGLTTWKAGAVRRTDVTTAKNYLNENEIQELNRIVTMWLDFAEDQARRRKQVFINDWAQKLDEFLAFNDRRVLPNAGKVSKKQAEEYALDEYAQFEVSRRREAEQVGEAETITELESATKRLRQKSKENH